MVDFKIACEQGLKSFRAFLSDSTISIPPLPNEDLVEREFEMTLQVLSGLRDLLPFEEATKFSKKVQKLISWANQVENSDIALKWGWVTYAKIELKRLVFTMSKTAWYLYPKDVRNAAGLQSSGISLTNSEKQLKHDIDEFLGLISYLGEWLENDFPSDAQRALAKRIFDDLKTRIPDFVRSLDLDRLEHIARTVETKARSFTVTGVDESGNLMDLQCIIPEPSKSYDGIADSLKLAGKAIPEGEIISFNPSLTNQTFFFRIFTLDQYFGLRRLDLNKVTVPITVGQSDVDLLELAKKNDGAVITLPLQSLPRDDLGRFELPCPRGSKIIAANIRNLELYRSNYGTYACKMQTGRELTHISFLIVEETTRTELDYPIPDHPRLPFTPKELAEILETRSNFDKRPVVANLLAYLKLQRSVYSADLWVHEILGQLTTFEQKVLALLALGVYNCETASKLLMYLLGQVGIHSVLVEGFVPINNDQMGNFQLNFGCSHLECEYSLEDGVFRLSAGDIVDRSDLRIPVEQVLEAGYHELLVALANSTSPTEVYALVRSFRERLNPKPDPEQVEREHLLFGDGAPQTGRDPYLRDNTELRFGYVAEIINECVEIFNRAVKSGLSLRDIKRFCYLITSPELSQLTSYDPFLRQPEIHQRLNESAKERLSKLSFWVLTEEVLTRGLKSDSAEVRTYVEEFLGKALSEFSVLNSGFRRSFVPLLFFLKVTEMDLILKLPLETQLVLFFRTVGEISYFFGRASIPREIPLEKIHALSTILKNSISELVTNSDYRRLRKLDEFVNLQLRSFPLDIGGLIGGWLKYPVTAENKQIQEILENFFEIAASLPGLKFFVDRDSKIFLLLLANTSFSAYLSQLGGEIFHYRGYGDVTLISGSRVITVSDSSILRILALRKIGALKHSSPQVKAIVQGILWRYGEDGALIDNVYKVISRLKSVNQELGIRDLICFYCKTIGVLPEECELSLMAVYNWSDEETRSFIEERLSQLQRGQRGRRHREVSFLIKDPSVLDSIYVRIEDHPLAPYLNLLKNLCYVFTNLNPEETYPRLPGLFVKLFERQSQAIEIRFTEPNTEGLDGMWLEPYYLVMPNELIETFECGYFEAMELPWSRLVRLLGSNPSYRGLIVDGDDDEFYGVKAVNPFEVSDFRRINHRVTARLISQNKGLIAVNEYRKIDGDDLSVKIDLGPFFDKTSNFDISGYHELARELGLILGSICRQRNQNVNLVFTLENHKLFECKVRHKDYARIRPELLSLFQIIVSLGTLHFYSEMTRIWGEAQKKREESIG